MSTGRWETYIDKSAESYLVVCTECPGFAEVVTSKEAAKLIRLEHRERVHPRDQAGRHAARKGVVGNLRD